VKTLAQCVAGERERASLDGWGEAALLVPGEMEALSDCPRFVIVGLTVKWH